MFRLPRSALPEAALRTTTPLDSISMEATLSLHLGDEAITIPLGVEQKGYRDCPELYHTAYSHTRTRHKSVAYLHPKARFAPVYTLVTTSTYTISSRTTTKAKVNYTMSDQTQSSRLRARLQKPKKQMEDMSEKVEEAMDRKFFAKKPTVQILLIDQKHP
ncbi:hypothetical protein CHU98_g822 [Xylaria longipes]|nr:hypothetical protein CHU98_g822 [Xylaria longipes]